MPLRLRLLQWRGSTLLAAAGGLLAALLLAVAAAWLLHERHQVQDQHAARMQWRARALQERASKDIDQALAALRLLSAQAASGAAPAAQRVLLEHVMALQPQLRELALLDEDGRVRLASRPADVGLRVDRRALGAWPAAGGRAVGRHVAGGQLRELQAGHRGAEVSPGHGAIVLLSAHVDAEGHGGMALALLDEASLAEGLEAVLDDSAAAAALVGADGTVLVATRGAGRSPGAPLPAGALRAALRDVAESGRDWAGTGLRGAAQTGSVRHLPGLPLAVAVESAEAGIRSEWMRTVQGAGAVAVAGALASLLLALLAADSQRIRERAQHQLDVARQQAATHELQMVAIFDTVQDLLFRTDAQGRLTFVNERFVTSRAGSVLGRRLQDLFDGGEALAALFEPPAPGQRAEPRRAQAAWMDGGRRRSVNITVVPLPLGDSVCGWVGSATEVGELMQAQAELKAQLGFARSLLANSPLPTSVLDREGRYLDVNHAWEQFTGLSRDEVVGHRARELQTTQQAALHEARDSQLMHDGGEMRYEAPWRDRDGRIRDLFVCKSVFRDTEGRAAGIVVAFMDVSEFRAAERATRAAHDAALQASQAKSEFIANMSHELRTPLQTILGFSELGRLRAHDQPRLAAMFDDVHRAGRRMLALVNDLLDLSRLEDGADTLQPERADLRPLVAQVAGELGPMAQRRQQRLRLRTADAQVVALVDAPRLQQVLRHVLCNAIKFSPEGAAIDVDCDVNDEQEVELCVADRGPGIPAGELRAIFEAFVQSSATKDGSGGTGLGLAISRRIVEAHGGRIEAANRDGGGSLFRITLPSARFGDTTPAAL